MKQVRMTYPEDLYLLPAQGEKGVQDVLEILKEEFRLAMALSGKTCCFNLQLSFLLVVFKPGFWVEKKSEFEEQDDGIIKGCH